MTGVEKSEEIKKAPRFVIQRLQSAPLVVHSCPVLAAESQYTTSQESAELIPALQPLLFLCKGGGGGRQAGCSQVIQWLSK